MQNKPTKDHRHPQKGLEELKREAVSAYRETHQLARDTVASAWETGKLLTEIKSRLNHGEWLPWLKSAGIPQRTASDWMRISQISSAANLTSIRAALKEASFLSDLERIWPNYRDHWPLIEPRIQAGQRDPEKLLEDTRSLSDLAVRVRAALAGIVQVRGRRDCRTGRCAKGRGIPGPKRYAARLDRRARVDLRPG